MTRLGAHIFMSDSPKDSPAWKLDPATYFESRSPTHTVPVPKSLYLEMPDGVRLATCHYDRHLRVLEMRAKTT